MSKPVRDGQRMSLTQYEQLREDDMYRSELSRGRLVREPRPGAVHSRVVVNLLVELQAYVKAHDLGSVETECGFRLSLDEPTVRGPDVAFIARERLPAELPRGFWPFAPDLAIEVASPSNSLSELQTKVLEYFDAGSRMVWVIDPETRTALVYHSPREITLLRDADSLEADPVIPGFHIALSTILP
jgi:Uma2 family endonuclease